MPTYILRLIREIFYGNATASGSNALVDDAKTEIRSHYSSLDGLLTGRDWVGVDLMTVADVADRLTTLFATSLGAGPSEELTALGG